MGAQRTAREGKSMNSAARIGSSSPLGVIEGGANFSLFSRGATGVELPFFDNESDARPSRVIHIDPAANRTYHYWHVFVPVWNQDKFTATVSREPPIPRRECDLIPPRYSSRRS